jgi:hypothetical protein
MDYWQVEANARHYAQKAYRYAESESRLESKFDWCSRYEGLKAAILWELADRKRKALKRCE